MKTVKTKLLLVLLLLGFVSPAWGLPFTHYAADSLRLRSSGSSTASVTTVLQPLMGLEILERGTAARINGISANWVKVRAENGSVGWCFSGHLKPIESNVAKSLGKYIAHRKSGAYPPNTFNPKFENVLSIDEVKSQTGYYIEQFPRRFQGTGRAPEILQLMVSDGRVLVREVDVQNGKTVIRLETEFKYDGTTFSHMKSTIKKQNGKIYLLYREHPPEEEWLGTWQHEDPYSFVCDLESPMPPSIQRLTSDYLQNYAGTYVFDSYVILKAKNSKVNTKKFRSAKVHIGYDVKKKALSVPCHDLLDITDPDNGVGDYTLYFIETLGTEPFFWTYGEGDGFNEEKYWFYKGGIAISHEQQGPDDDDDGNVTKEIHEKYVIFLKKVK
ncbi:MAG: hypothetical protein C0392_15600 [Syntrophus sp. (in: bacteria)]|nr:hypothetical protein [Syntrophus sp. (in: bacteria)]